MLALEGHRIGVRQAILLFRKRRRAIAPRRRIASSSQPYTPREGREVNGGDSTSSYWVVTHTCTAAEAVGTIQVLFSDPKSNSTACWRELTPGRHYCRGHDEHRHVGHSSSAPVSRFYSISVPIQENKDPRCGGNCNVNSEHPPSFHFCFETPAEYSSKGPPSLRHPGCGAQWLAETASRTLAVVSHVSGIRQAGNAAQCAAILGQLASGPYDKVAVRRIARDLSKREIDRVPADFLFDHIKSHTVLSE